ncbi:MAG: glycosyltransferase family 4 protein [Hyphomonadaceae bacterium]
MRARRDLDGVVSISAYDAQTEGWLGSRQATWLPRMVSLAALDWRPHADRFGFVGTLDHAPNLEGLEAILVAIASSKSEAIRIRIVGGPDRIGRWLASRFPFVDYLGTLDDAGLKAEASTWRAFLNPIFCQARGCSTKVATALSWGIPVVTTEYGRRGYVWSDGCVIEADTPAAFARQMLDLLSEAGARRAHEGVAAAAANSPSLTDVAGKLRNFIDIVEASIRGAAPA